MRPTDEKLKELEDTNLKVLAEQNRHDRPFFHAIACILLTRLASNPNNDLRALIDRTLTTAELTRIADGKFRQHRPLAGDTARA